MVFGFWHSNCHVENLVPLHGTIPCEVHDEENFCVFLGFLLLIPMTTFSVEAGQVMYVGGTVAALKEGVSGQLDTSSQTLLRFDYSGSKLAIPFKRIDSYEYSQRVARYLGFCLQLRSG